MENLDFLSLLKTIEEFYKGEDGENLEILCPLQNQACVAKFEDGIWYRAKVIGRKVLVISTGKCTPEQASPEVLESKSRRCYLLPTCALSYVFRRHDNFRRSISGY
jgi:hypothetical protein